MYSLRGAVALWECDVRLSDPSWLGGMSTAVLSGGVALWCSRDGTRMRVVDCLSQQTASLVGLPARVTILGLRKGDTVVLAGQRVFGGTQGTQPQFRVQRY